jgi:hypothetical protein
VIDYKSLNRDCQKRLERAQNEVLAQGIEPHPSLRAGTSVSISRISQPPVGDKMMVIGDAAHPGYLGVCANPA